MEIIREYPGASSSDNKHPVLLVLDDKEEVRTSIRDKLDNEYIITEAENGEAGLSVARKTIPDLIITNVLIPKMDGFHFCRELRKDARTNHIPVILLSGKAGCDEKIKGLESGADDYFARPFNTKELKARIRNLIDQRRLLRSRFSKGTVIKPSEVAAMSVDQVFLKKTVAAIEANFENPDFTINKLAKEVNMSVSHLNRKLNALIDQPAGQLMRSLRLYRAAELLDKKAESVSQIGYKLGFNDQAYFSRAFKKHFGCNPSEYMNS
jgi:two-component system, sensor histidine kinase ChiS